VIAIALGDLRIAVFLEMLADVGLAIKRVRVDQPEADAARGELVVQPLDFRSVPVRNGAVGADEDQYGHRQRAYHSVLNLRQIVSQGRRSSNVSLRFRPEFAVAAWYDRCSIGVQRLHREASIRAS
jgi:hypothetical protein